ncbi:MAG TPA: Bcr/CflA family drug resistance efflux transporter, partial [Myxococcota bacterium]
ATTSAWRALLSDRRFVRFTLAGGCAQAAMFAYIAGSSFVLIELFGVAADDYGFFFGANATALIAASQLNRRLLSSTTPDVITRWSARAVVVAAVLVVVAGVATSSLWALAAALFVFLGTLGFVTPNTGALALDGQGARAGLASAVMGCSQFALAALAAAAVSALHDGTALPMVGVMAVLSTVSWLLLETAPRR